MHPKGRSRTRRLDKHLVQHLVEAVVKAKEFPSAGRAARAMKSLDVRTARAQETGHMVRYIASTAKCFSNACQAFVVSDDVRVSGEWNQCAAIWVRQRKTAVWLVTQVVCPTKPLDRPRSPCPLRP